MNIKYLQAKFNDRRARKARVRTPMMCLARATYVGAGEFMSGMHARRPKVGKMAGAVNG